MQRDWDLIRKIVLAVENHPNGFAPQLQFDGYTPEQVGYHSYLLVDAQLAQGIAVTTNANRSPVAKITYLTWAGHEFAEAARDNTRWNRAMGIVRDKGGAITMNLLGQLLGGIMKSTFGLP
jgi:hypothetical protein